MAIHPTALVEPGAQVDPTCEIGPYAVVGPHVKLGARTVVAAHAIVTGHTTLGEGNRVFPHAVIGEIPQDLKYRGEPTALVIGDKNTFRESVTINLGTVQGGGVTTIGNGCLFMAYSHVGHDCRIADGAIIANSVALAGLNPVRLQRAGMTEEQVGRVTQLYTIAFRTNLGLAEALAQVAAELGS